MSRFRQGEGWAGWGRRGWRPPAHPQRPPRTLSAGRGWGVGASECRGVVRGGRLRSAGWRGPHRSVPRRVRVWGPRSRLSCGRCRGACVCASFLRSEIDPKSNTPRHLRRGRPPVRPRGRTRAPLAAAPSQLSSRSFPVSTEPAAGGRGAVRSSGPQAL